MWTWETTRAAVLAGTSGYSSVETTSSTLSGITTSYSTLLIGTSTSTNSTQSSSTGSGVGGTTQTESFQDFVVYQLQTIGSTESGSNIGSGFASIGPNASGSTTTTFSQITALTSNETDGSTRTTTAYTSVVGASTTTASGHANNPAFSFTYPFSTTTATTNTPVVTTETSTLGVTYPNTATTSVTTTTTGSPTSTTVSVNTTVLSSSAYTATVSVTSTATFNTTIVGSATAANNLVLTDTVVLAASTDWLWSLTAAGPGDPTAVGVSFTQTTISFTFGSSAPPVALYPQSVTTFATTSYTAATNYQSTTTTYTTSASTSSTYAVGAASTTMTTTFGSTTGTTLAAALPLTSTTAETITYLTVQTTTLTYCSQETSSFSFAYFAAASATVSSTQDDGTYVTTGAGGTLTTHITYTIASQNAESANGAETIFFGGGNSSSSQTATFRNGTATVTVTNTTTQVASGLDLIALAVVSVATYQSGAQAAQTFTSAVDPGGATITFESMLSVTDSTIPPGWQPTPSSFGADNSVGTNISGPASIEATGSGWPSVSLAVPTGTETYILTGTVPTTDVNQLSTTAFGGFDWISTTSTKGTLTVGILRITTCDSFSNTGTLETTFDTVHSTYSIASGQGIAAETVPAVYSTSSSQEPNPFVAFPAFPVTT